MKAIIAGGGIAGLTSALALHARGWDVVVLEQARELSEIGAGLQLSPNAMKVMRALGLDAALEEVGFRPQALELRLGESGQSVFSIPAGKAAETRWGAPYLHIHRRDLLDVLAEALEAKAPEAVRLSSRVIGYRHRPRGVQALLEDGETVDGDLLVGADGIHSAIRAQMIGPDRPDFTGNVAWRAVLPTAALGKAAPPPTACVWAGKGRHGVTYRLRGGELTNFVGVSEQKVWSEESWTQKGTREDALSDFEGWVPEITQLLEVAEHHYRWALFDRKPLNRWSEGAVVLVGDAAHPTLPFLAQGAAMAIEDAYVLAQECARLKADLSAALLAFQRRRIERTSKVQAGSRANMKTFHRRLAPMRLATYGPMWMAGRVAPGFVSARLDWLYGHDVTARG